MNERQRRFADEYIRLGNATQAARNAGYSENYAMYRNAELLNNVAIKTYIDARLEELKKQSIAEQDEILQFLTSVVRGDATGRMKVGTGGGSEKVVDERPTIQERVRA